MGDQAATPPGLWERIDQKIEAAVAKLLRSGLLRNASISDGGLTIKGGFLKLRAPGAATDTLYVGGVLPVAPDGSLQPGIIITRNDGTKAFTLADGSPTTDGYFQHWNWFDRGGNNLFADDTTSGQGLARPWLPIPMYPRDTLGAGGRIATMSSTFTTLWAGEVPKQQPKLFAAIILGGPMGGSVEARILVNGSQVGDVATVSTELLAYKLFGPVAVPGSHMSTALIEVQARLASGMGAASVAMHRMEGRQS